MGISLSTTAPRPVLGPTKLPIQWVAVALSLGVKRPGRETDHSPHLVPRSRMRGGIPPLPNTPSRRGAQLKHTGNFIFSLPYIKIHDISVGIAPGYGLDDRGSRVRFPEGAGIFSLHHRVQNGSGAHPVYYPMGARGCFLGDKVAGV
jgi:hypothetical protein